MATAAILNITKKSRYLCNGLTDLYEIWYEDAKQQTFLRVLPTRWRQKNGWHRYGSKLRHCHFMYMADSCYLENRKTAITKYLTDIQAL